MAPNPPNHKRILVVEDDAATRDAVALMLESEGYQVSGAANGQEALAHMRGSGPPDLILLDLMMPVMNGLEFRRHQHADPALAHIPIVVVSADGNVSQKAALIGVSDYLRKPVDLDKLLATVQRYL